MAARGHRRRARRGLGVDLERTALDRRRAVAGAVAGHEVEVVWSTVGKRRRRLVRRRLGNIDTRPRVAPRREIEEHRVAGEAGTGAAVRRSAPGHDEVVDVRPHSRRQTGREHRIRRRRGVDLEVADEVVTTRAVPVAVERQADEVDDRRRAANVEAVAFLTEHQTAVHRQGRGTGGAVVNHAVDAERDIRRIDSRLAGERLEAVPAGGQQAVVPRIRHVVGVGVADRVVDRFTEGHRERGQRCIRRLAFVEPGAGRRSRCFDQRHRRRRAVDREAAHEVVVRDRVAVAVEVVAGGVGERGARQQAIVAGRQRRATVDREAVGRAAQGAHGIDRHREILRRDAARAGNGLEAVAAGGNQAVRARQRDGGRHPLAERDAELRDRQPGGLAFAELIVRSRRHRVHQVHLRRHEVDRVGSGLHHRAPVSRHVAGTDLDVPVAVHESGAGEGGAAGLLAAVAGRRSAAAELHRVAGDAGALVGRGGPAHRDGRIDRRQADRVVGRDQAAHRPGRHSVDPERTEVDSRATVAGRVSGPDVDPPVVAVRRTAASKGRSCLRRCAGRFGGARLVVDDRVAGDAVGIGRAAEAEVDAVVVRPGRDGVAARADRQAGRRRRVDDPRATVGRRTGVAGEIDGADVEVPAAVGERRRERRALVLVAVRLAVAVFVFVGAEVEAVAGDAGEPVARGAPGDVDRRVGDRAGDRIVARARDRAGRSRR